MRRVSLLIASGLFLASGAPAMAHADLIEMTPKVGSVLATAPLQVELLFSEEVQTLGTAVAVLDPSGSEVQQDVSVDGATVRVQLDPLRQSGEYHVNFRVLAADGHVVAASKTFTLDLAGTAAALAGGESPPEVSLVQRDSASVAYWITGLLMLCAIVAVVAVRQWRASMTS